MREKTKKRLLTTPESQYSQLSLKVLYVVSDCRYRDLFLPQVILKKQGQTESVRHNRHVHLIPVALHRDKEVGSEKYREGAGIPHRSSRGLQQQCSYWLRPSLVKPSSAFSGFRGPRHRLLSAPQMSQLQSCERAFSS